MGYNFDEDDKIIKIMNKMRYFMRTKDYRTAIRLGITLYNNLNFYSIKNYNKYILLYNLGVCYQKIKLFDEAIHFSNMALEYTIKPTQDYYNAILLISECEISLNIDNKDIILSRYSECNKYYKSINSRLKRAYVLYDTAKYKQRVLLMYYLFRIIVTEGIIAMPIFITYNKREDILVILDDFKRLDYAMYKDVCDYLVEIENDYEYENLNS